MLALSLLLADARATAGDGDPVQGLSLPTDFAGTGGAWSPNDVLRTLPSESDLRHLPVMAEMAQLTLLQGTDAYSLATGLRSEVEETHRELSGLLSAPSSPLQGGDVTLSRWRWSRRRESRGTARPATDR